VERQGSYISETYGPFNSGGGASILESQWREFIGALFTSGVLKGAKVNGSAGNDLAVSAPGGAMSVNLATGVACAYGFFYENDATLAKTIAASDPSLARIDRVVIRLDLAGRTVQSAVLTGTPSGSPVAPTLTQTSTTWEIPIARIAVGAGVTQIVGANVTDERVYTIPNLAGNAIGNASGNIPLSNGTLNTSLNADKVDGADAGNASGNVALANGTVVTNLNADKVDGKDASAFLDLAAGGTVSGAVDFTSTLTKSGNTIWHAGNDGPGSGLDADLVDGLQASAFAQLSGATFTNTVNVSSGNLQRGGKNALYANSGLTGKWDASVSPPGSPADGDLWLDMSVVL
jgi:hypothetical protein